MISCINLSRVTQLSAINWTRKQMDYIYIQDFAGGQTEILLLYHHLITPSFVAFGFDQIWILWLNFPKSTNDLYLLSDWCRPLRNNWLWWICENNDLTILRKREKKGGLVNPTSNANVQEYHFNVLIKNCVMSHVLNTMRI